MEKRGVAVLSIFSMQVRCTSAACAGVRESGAGRAESDRCLPCFGGTTAAANTSRPYSLMHAATCCPPLQGWGKLTAAVLNFACIATLKYYGGTWTADSVRVCRRVSACSRGAWLS